MGYYYIYTNNINLKKYIGQTVKTVMERYHSGSGYNSQIFGRALRKYGRENFTLESYEVCNFMLDFMEIHLISYYNTTDSRYGYNCTNGGNKNKVYSATSRRRMSEAQMGNTNAKGAKYSDEIRQRMSERTKGKYCKENNPFYGKHHSEEARQRLSDSLKGNSNKKGKKLSDESRRRVSESQMGSRNHNYGKPRSEDTRVKIGKAHEKYLYVIQTPSGITETTTTLAGYCKEHNIRQQHMQSRGKSKGYTVIYKTPIVK